MAVSPEPSGPRKISTRKSRAARLSPMEGLAAIRKHSWTPPFSGRPKNNSLEVVVAFFSFPY